MCAGSDTPLSVDLYNSLGEFVSGLTNKKNGELVTTKRDFDGDGTE